MHISFHSFKGATRPLALAALSVAIVGALFAPGTASASAFQLKENSAKGLGRAYAGSATAGGDASVVANNPAAMTELDGTYLQADVTAINFSAKFDGSAHDVLQLGTHTLELLQRKHVVFGQIGQEKVDDLL